MVAMGLGDDDDDDEEEEDPGMANKAAGVPPPYRSIIPRKRNGMYL